MEQQNNSCGLLHRLKFLQYHSKESKCDNQYNQWIIGASLSEPHTYEVIGEMFVCNHDTEHSTDNLQPFQGSDVTCNTWC